MLKVTQVLKVEDTKQQMSKLCMLKTTLLRTDVKRNLTLENFGLQEEGSFELFDNASENQSTLEQESKETEEEDELEIPAFLRRQKN